MKLESFDIRRFTEGGTTGVFQSFPGVWIYGKEIMLFKVMLASLASDSSWRQAQILRQLQLVHLLKSLSVKIFLNDTQTRTCLVLSLVSRKSISSPKHTQVIIFQLSLFPKSQRAMLQNTEFADQTLHIAKIDISMCNLHVTRLCISNE